MKQFGGDVLFLDRSDINTDEIIDFIISFNEKIFNCIKDKLLF